MDEPTVSIIITCHDYGAFLADAIKSALGQTLKPLEVVVVDDGSTDDTAAVAAGFPDVRYVFQHNQGVAAARNRGGEEARGDFILFLDADDILDADFLAETAAALRRRAGAAFCYTDQRMFGAKTGAMTSVPFDPCHLVTRGNYISVTSLLLKRPFHEVGGFSDLPALEDWDFWLKLTERGYEGVYLPKTLNSWRIHDRNRTTAADRRIRHLTRQVQARHWKLYLRWLPEHLYKLAHWRLGQAFGSHGR